MGRRLHSRGKTESLSGDEKQCASWGKGVFRNPRWGSRIHSIVVWNSALESGTSGSNPSHFSSNARELGCVTSGGLSFHSCNMGTIDLSLMAT